MCQTSLLLIVFFIVNLVIFIYSENINNRQHMFEIKSRIKRINNQNLQYCLPQLIKVILYLFDQLGENQSSKSLYCRTKSCETIYIHMNLHVHNTYHKSQIMFAIQSITFETYAFCLSKVIFEKICVTEYLLHVLQHTPLNYHNFLLNQLVKYSVLNKIQILYLS